MNPPTFDRYLETLEACYRPRWSVYAAVVEAVGRSGCDEVFDFGAGTARLAKALEAADTEVTRYIGLERDRDRLTFAQQTCCGQLETILTDSFVDFSARLRSSAHPVFIAAFCLHDQASFANILEALDSTTAGAVIVAWDLTPNDFPRLSRIFRDAVGELPAVEVRNQIARFGDALVERGWVVSHSRQNHSIEFPTLASVWDYIDAFKLADGDDLGIRVTADGIGTELRSAARRLSYPFVDDREFACLEARRAA